MLPQSLGIVRCLLQYPSKSLNDLQFFVRKTNLKLPSKKTRAVIPLKHDEKHPKIKQTSFPFMLAEIVYTLVS